MKMFSVINNNARIALGLRFKEYFFLDTIASDTLYKEDIPRIAEFMGISKIEMKKIVNRLKSMGIFFEYDNGQIYPSQEFIDLAYGLTCKKQ